ncbi:MAG: hypothetical protein ABFC55_00860 [Tenuifilaceae bacterium]
MLKNSSYKLLGLTLLLILAFSSISFAQSRGDSLVIARDYCKVIYKELKKTYKTDSLAMQKLLENYVFDNQVHFSSKQWEKALLYIMKEENGYLQCSLKSFVLEKSLILEKKK